MDRRMAASCSSSSSSSSRPTPSAPRDNFEAVLSDAKNLIKKGKDEKGRGDGRRHSRDFNNESTVRRPSRERELKKKVNFSKGDRILADKKSLTSKSGKQQVSAHGDNSQKCPSSRVSRETPGVERSSSLVIFDAVDPEWAAAMNKRYGLDGEESPFNVVDETEEETSPPRQPKRADETPPAEASRPRAPSPAPPPPGPPLPKLQSPVKPKSDPYECEDEDPATAALRREIRIRDEDLRGWIGANLNEPLFLSLLQDKMEKRKRMVDRLEELKKPPMTPESVSQKDEYVPCFEARRNASLEFDPMSSDRKRRGNDRSRTNKSTDNSFRSSHYPKKEEVASRGQRVLGRGKRELGGDGGADNGASGIDWKKLKLENEKKREVDRASQMNARNRLAALAGGYCDGRGEAVDSPPEPDEASTSSGFGGRSLNPERTYGREAREERFEETEIVVLDSDDDEDDDYPGESQRNLSSDDLLAAHGIRVVGQAQRKVQPFNQDSPETIVLSDEQEDEWEEMQKEEEQSENVEVEETKDGDENDPPATLSLDAPDIEGELNKS